MDNFFCNYDIDAKYLSKLRLILNQVHYESDQRLIYIKDKFIYESIIIRVILELYENIMQIKTH